MIILDTLLIGGIKFVLRRIADAVDAQMNDVDALREELLAAQMRLELGEMSPGEFAALERDLLARLREIRERATGEDSGPTRITGIDVSVTERRVTGGHGIVRRDGSPALLCGQGGRGQDDLRGGGGAGGGGGRPAGRRHLD